MDEDKLIINKGLSYENDDYTTRIHFICPNCKIEYAIDIKREV